MSTSSWRLLDTVLPKRTSSQPASENQKTEAHVQSYQSSLKRVQKMLDVQFQQDLQGVRDTLANSQGKKRKVLADVDQNREYVYFSQQNGKVFKFPVYTEKELGFDSSLQDQLNQPYDEDDDIDTRMSVVLHFIEVCKKDLVDGIKLQKEEQKKAELQNANQKQI